MRVSLKSTLAAGVALCAMSVGASAATISANAQQSGYGFGFDPFTTIMMRSKSSQMFVLVNAQVPPFVSPVTMWMRNSAARPVSYHKKEWAHHTSRKSLSSSTMIASGLFLMIFVIVHVKQFKFGTFYLTQGPESIRDLYRTEIEVFRNIGWVIVYVLATLLVGLHLRHGFSSAFQSLGLDHPRYTRRLVGLGIFFAILIGGGLAVIPIFVYLTK